MPASITDKAPLKALIDQFNAQANKDQSVKSSDLDGMLKKVEELAKDQLISASDKIALNKSIGNLKSVTDGTFGKNTTESNKRWEESIADINKLVDGEMSDPVLSGVTGGHGPGTAYKNMTLNDAKMAGLPDAVASLQATNAPGGAQQVNKLTDKNGKSFFVASDNANPINYTVFNNDGKNMGTMKPGDALGLNNDKGFMMLSKDGLGSSITGQLSDVDASAKLYDLNNATDKLLDGKR